VLDSRFAETLERLDWVVVDLGPASAACGIVGYLHGRFVPMMRLCRTSLTRSGSGPPTPLEVTLYGEFEVGYVKDIVRWADAQSLKAEIDRRIQLLEVESTYIVTREQAMRYFREAALRNEALFVSYSGKDADEARKVIAALRQRFQKVFDYRGDDGPIPAGTQWVEQIFAQIAARPLGIILLSPAYLQSGNCRHESSEMIAQRDSGKMKVVPIKLHEVQVPPELGSTQYLRAWDYDDAQSLVAAFIRDIDGDAGRKN
jgi:hypothetical protein